MYRDISPASGESIRDRHQKLTIYSMAHCQPYLKISCKSVAKFLRKVAKTQTSRQRRKHYLGAERTNIIQTGRSYFNIRKFKFSVAALKLTTA